MVHAYRQTCMYAFSSTIALLCGFVQIKFSEVLRSGKSLDAVLGSSQGEQEKLIRAAGAQIGLGSPAMKQHRSDAEMNPIVRGWEEPSSLV